MKTPVSRVGNKTSILHILYAVFPPKYDRFIDVFGGSGSVLLGSPYPCNFEVYIFPGCGRWFVALKAIKATA